MENQLDYQKMKCFSVIFFMSFLWMSYFFGQASGFNTVAMSGFVFVLNMLDKL